MRTASNPDLAGMLSRLSQDSSLLTRHRVDFRETLVHAAWKGLGKTIPEVLRASAVQHGFCRALSARLDRTGHQVFAARGVSWPRNQKDLLDIFKEFRGLPKVWDAQIRRWSRFVLLFAEHATAFQNTIEPRSPITQLSSDLSDLHDGRSVTRVRFQKGGLWYYKPRSGRREAAWSRFLLAINAAGFCHQFFVPEIRPGRLHCWMRGVSARKNRSIAGRRRLYFRTGALLYLAHCFRAVDFHADNFVLYFEHPVLVDCETLFHPETNLPASAFVDENDLERTGMIGKARTHAMIKSDDELVGSLGRQRREELARGFSAMHEFLRDHAAHHHLQRLIKEMRREKTRCVLRPTIFYSRVLDEVLTPNRLRKWHGLTREIHARLDDGLCRPSIVRREVQQLACGDIPYFNGRAAPPRGLSSMRQLDRMLAELQAI